MSRAHAGGSALHRLHHPSPPGQTAPVLDDDELTMSRIRPIMATNLGLGVFLMVIGVGGSALMG